MNLFDYFEYLSYNQADEQDKWTDLEHFDVQYWVSFDYD